MLTAKFQGDNVYFTSKGCDLIDVGRKSVYRTDFELTESHFNVIVLHGPNFSVSIDVQDIYS